MRRRPARLASLGFSLTLTASALQHSRPARLALAFTLLTRSASALHHAQRPKVLLVDCHDSYTHNVASWLHDAGATPEVVAADDAAFEQALDADARALLQKYDALVLSPGPGHPAHVHNTLHQCLRHADDMPILGVCLGHQFLALSEGGAVKRLQEPQHGLVSRVAHTGSRLFKDMEQGFEATRYHSLTVDETSLKNSDLRIMA
jgi:anthranilate synthase/aminodeoxychorismate synthase-like glutamine amidotransferase